MAYSMIPYIAIQHDNTTKTAEYQEKSFAIHQQQTNAKRTVNPYVSS